MTALIVTPDDMARADRDAVAGGTSIELLMERAGRASARQAIRLAGGRYGKRAVVVCGRGNNGGDGIVAARVLHQQGLATRCVLVIDEHELSGPARHHLQVLKQSGCALMTRIPPSFEADVLVDAVFGTGFHGTAEGASAHAIEAINRSGAPVLSIDIPSGVNGLTGAIEGVAVRADATVALAAEKRGTVLAPGAINAGHVVVADIGIDVSESTGHVAWGDGTSLRDWVASREHSAHKRSSGSVVLFAGSSSMPGAAVLTCLGCVHMGAGYVTLVTPPQAKVAVSPAAPEVIVLESASGDWLGAEALDRAGEAIDRCDAIAVGPGLGQGRTQNELVNALLSGVNKRMVLDADALNVLAGDTSALIERGKRHVAEGWHRVAITPHPAELARLLDSTTEDIQADRIGAVLQAASTFDCEVVLKGWHTVIARPGQQVSVNVNPTGGPELATAGTGDVLTGAAAAVLTATDSVQPAVWAHGRAGELAREELGVRGVLAHDVARFLPAAVADSGVFRRGIA
jgi:NAD(P)H-hydrate epimerase